MPERWDRLVEHPDLIPGAVDEILRFDPSVPVWRRVTDAAGERSAASTCPRGRSSSSGSRPPAATPRSSPTRTFDPERDNARRTLAFGRGIHFCIGSALGRLEATLALEELTRRFPGLRLAPPDQEIPFHPNISFRGPQTLGCRRDAPGDQRPAAGRQPAGRLHRGRVPLRRAALRRPRLRAAGRRDRPARGWVRYEREQLARPERGRRHRRGDRVADRHPAARLRDAGVRVRPGVSELRFDSWPRIDDAIACYAVFRELRDGGRDPGRAPLPGRAAVPGQRAERVQGRLRRRLPGRRPRASRTWSPASSCG